MLRSGKRFNACVPAALLRGPCNPDREAQVSHDAAERETVQFIRFGSVAASTILPCELGYCACAIWARR